MNVSGCYINLDASVVRKERIEANLARTGMSQIVRRFAAVQVNKSNGTRSLAEQGCFLSHQAVVSGASPGDFCLVLEDDVFLPQNFRNWLFAVLNSASNSTWDILFLGQLVDYRTPIGKIKHLLDLKNELSGDVPEFRLLPGATWYKLGSFAYVVHAGSLAKVQQILEASGRAGCNTPIDKLYQQLAASRSIRTAVLFPYIVGVDSSFPTTMRDRKDNEDDDLHNDMVNLFVRGGDLDLLFQRAQSEAAHADRNRDAFIISQIIHRVLKRKTKADGATGGNRQETQRER